jgi:ferredoxin
MAYLVTEACIRCKFMDCVTVCPVDCFYEGANMVAINPQQCIDCGSCEPICPSQAIISDIDDPSGRWLAFNADYAGKWPRMRQRGTSPSDAETWKDVGDKLASQFDPTPAAR